jgi:glycosyltransferase involved in cell wall biosynthesis
VGINCLDVNPSFVGGVTTYVTGLLDGLANVGNGCRFRIFAAEGNRYIFDRIKDHPDFEIIVVHDGLLSFRAKVSRMALLSGRREIFKAVNDHAFRKIREMMDAESDIIYTPSPVLRCFDSRKPTVLTMHDIQHVHHPEFFSWPRRLSRTITYGLSARHANFIQANSQSTKRDFLEHFPELSDEHVEVIPVGVNLERFAESTVKNDVCDRYALPERFLFYPAQLWLHKNHLTILKALKKIENKWRLKIPLVLTGAKYSAASQVLRFMEDQSMGYVYYLGPIPNEDIVSLYRKAAFLIMATLHESGGFPILESAASGTPIIASRIPPFEEFAQGFQLSLFDPLDADGLACLIRRLWYDQATAAVQSAHNREHVHNYSWENAARKYLRLFARAFG